MNIIITNLLLDFMRFLRQNTASSALLRSLLCVWYCMLMSACSQNSSQTSQKQDSIAKKQALVRSGGAVFSIPAEQAQHFSTIQIQQTRFVQNLHVSARTIAAALPSSDLQQPLVIFEAQEMAQLYSTYIKDKAVFDKNSKQLLRMKELLTNNAASGKDLLEAQTDKNQSEAELREAESRLLQSGFNPKQLENMRAGAILMVCDVPESRLSGVSLGEPAEFEFTSFPNEKFRGRVTSIGNAVDPQTRTVKVSIEMMNSRGRIKPGMFAKVSIEEREIQAISIPHEAVVSADAKQFVFVKTSETSTGATIERRPISIGADNGTEFQIISGLRTGEHVIVKNAILLKGISFGY